MNQDKEINSRIIFTVIAILCLVLLGYYIARILTHKDVDIKVTAEEKVELDYLMQAIVYDGYNHFPKTTLSGIYFSNMSDLGKITVAAKYLYLKNNKKINPQQEEMLLDQETTDMITKQARKTFDSIFIKYRNFSLILDDAGCGASVFSTDYGIENTAKCALKASAFEIKDIYYEKNYYIVETYIAFGREFVKREGTLQCTIEEDKVMSYFDVYATPTFLTPYSIREYNRCCQIGHDCTLDGVAPKRDFMMEIAKKENMLYKIYFKKKKDNFIPYRIV